ncbi:hypothetical protein IG631_23793 [Alternaria alternata]|nr:hypothetical protein IG631_23793 [Alternaria alternata]
MPLDCPLPNKTSGSSALSTTSSHRLGQLELRYCFTGSFASSSSSLLCVYAVPAQSLHTAAQSSPCSPQPPRRSITPAAPP